MKGLLKSLSRQSKAASDAINLLCDLCSVRSVDSLSNTVPLAARGFVRGWQPCGLAITLLAVEEEGSAKNLFGTLVAGLGPARRAGFAICPATERTLLFRDH
jgi:hypothetical protein